jgi:ATP-dependent RNA helicase DDX24/MAK5
MFCYNHFSVVSQLTTGYPFTRIFTVTVIPDCETIPQLTMGLKSKRGRRKENAGNEQQNAEGCWKDVNVGFPASSDGGENDKDQDFTVNHYDNPELSHKAKNDLPAQPGEDVAMFYGLQVLDGSQYEVVGTGTSKRLKILSSPNDGGPSAEPEAGINTATVQNERKKEKQKKKTKGTVADTTSPKDSAGALVSPSPEATQVTSSLSWNEVQRNWTLASGGAVLNQSLCESLAKLGFSQPTPIQASTLSATILGRRNLVGAAPTGSGKTLAFLLPIFQSLLEESDSPKKLRALIIAPTRELATQIHAECEKLSPNQCVALVGGVAQVKQQRLLETRRPPIIVGTPGRLWAMVRDFNNSAKTG